MINPNLLRDQDKNGLSAFQIPRHTRERIAVATPPDQPFTDIPTVTPATPAKQVSDWFYLRRRQVESLAGQLDLKSGFDQGAMEALGKKIRAMEGRLAQGEQPATVVAAFQTWVGDYNDFGAWDHYVAWQKQLDQVKQGVQAKEADEKAVNQAKSRAAEAATVETGKRPGGLMAANGEYGRVIAGLAFVGNPGTAYFGISGKDMHAKSSAAVDQVIAELLKGTVKAEKWPQESCAEVDALKRYLTAASITSADNIPDKTLVFHAEVWNPGGTWSGKKTSPHWQARAACANCKQWVGKIGALLA